MMNEPVIVEKWPTKEKDLGVLDELKRRGPIDRDELAWYVRLPRTTVFDVLRRLQKRGLVCVFWEERTHRGRPKTFYQAEDELEATVYEIIRDEIGKDLRAV